MTAASGRRDAERGHAMSSFVSVVVVALILVAGLVVDGGAKANAARAAESGAAQAARAAVDAGATARAGGAGNGVEAARAAAEQELAERGLAGTVSIRDGRVRVETSTSAPTVFLSLIGVDVLAASGSAEAELRTP
ncbi:hypothetical protein [Propioniciclava soli]|uniref:hypothetical protein n=1 Tax=Propioniciclava soli TaxID=2775081 RepID=UPI001E46B9F4|nr:hypothetical protein [Propioniciclava soli]